MVSLTRSRLPIANPCREDFSRMDKRGARSFCDKCEKNVHDLTAMTKAQAGEFLAAHEGQRICVRYRAGADGTLKFRPAAPIVRGGAVAALAGLMAACTTHADPIAMQTPEPDTCYDHAGYAIACDEVETVIPTVEPGTEPLEPIVTDTTEIELPPGVPQVESCPLPNEPVEMMGSISVDFTPAEQRELKRAARRERRRARRS